MTIEKISLTPLSEHLGMQVTGVDLSRALDLATLEKLREALNQRSVLLFRDQQLTPEQHIALSRQFGEIQRHVVNQFWLPGYPDVYVVSNVIENGRPIGAHGGGREFHSDISYAPEPSLGSLFYCVECPPTGGDTEFASMSAAYDALPSERQMWLKTQRGVHDYAYYYETKLTHREPLTEAQKAQLVPSVHPAVRTHPESGRNAIYLSESLTRQLEGMSIEQSRPLIKEICDFATQPRFVYQHRWRCGDLVFWDNRSAMHRATPFDDQKYQRVMHRTTLQGDKPFLETDP